MLTFAFMHYPYLVCILFGMPSLHLFTFLMFFKSCCYNYSCHTWSSKCNHSYCYLRYLLEYTSYKIFGSGTDGTSPDRYHSQLYHGIHIYFTSSAWSVHSTELWGLVSSVSHVWSTTGQNCSSCSYLLQ